MKRLISSFVALVIIISSMGSVALAEEIVTPEVVKETSSFTNNVVVGDSKEIIGSVTVTTDSTGVTKTNGTEVTVDINYDYTILPAYQEEYGTMYNDSTDQTVVLFANNNELFINGEKKDIDAVQKGLSARAGDTGGFAAVCHYYSNDAWTSYTFRAYESMNYNWVGEGNGHGEPEGNHIAKYGVTSTNGFFNRARQDVDNFGNAYSNYRASYATALVGLTGSSLTAPWLGPPGLVSLGILSAVTAGGVIAMFNTAVTAEENAYASITRL
ncbi:MULTISPECIES: hypothetical protein [unclassified Paenibacillus]|uniref:hypothetical protein n=1 Tax=unclassified Paenibacillus TaxID=185978 RepID=UPI00096D6F66|nr:hypothetical protein BK146_31630 [Paenibacillus sp. FSL R7-0333]